MTSSGMSTDLARLPGSKSDEEQRRRARVRTADGLNLETPKSNRSWQIAIEGPAYLTSHSLRDRTRPHLHSLGGDRRGSNPRPSGPQPDALQREFSLRIGITGRRARFDDS